MSNAASEPDTQVAPLAIEPGVLRLFSVKEASVILDCSDMHIYRLIAAGELSVVDIAMPGAGRSKTRIRSDDLADWIGRKTRRARARPAPPVPMPCCGAPTGRKHMVWCL